MISWLRKRMMGRDDGRGLGASYEPAWEPILEKNTVLYGGLCAAEKERLRARTVEFLGSKSFEGCGGLELTEEMMVTVAGTASLLMMNRPCPLFPALFTVLLYPSVFRARHVEETDSGIVHESAPETLGESWESGSVILAWDAVRPGDRNHTPGQNIILHEFAHQLDLDDGAEDGAPKLDSREAQRTWAEVFREAFEERKWMRRMGHRCVLDDYATTHPAEFFAVSTEVFFERPARLERTFPRLYSELKRYFRFDPLSSAEEDRN